jgi:hypothetical protein
MSPIEFAVDESQLKPMARIGALMDLGPAPGCNGAML